jgi:4-hydroxy-tetrahydrodipicolinate synthase
MERAMETSRRAFFGMTAAAAAASSLTKNAVAATANIDPLKAPPARFWVAALTPCDKAGNFDNAANDAMLQFWKANGADGVLLLGTTGVGQSFSVAERKKILEMAAKNKHGLDFIVGTGAANLPETIELTRHAADHGADSSLIVPPYYIKNPKPEGVIAYFDQVFAQIKSPVRYYHIPRTTGVPVPVKVFEALKKYPNFVGVKDSNGDAKEFEAITAALPNLNVVTGTDNLLEATLSHGHGCILASGNVFCKYISAIFKAHREGQDTKALIARAAEVQKAVRVAATAADGTYNGGEAANKYMLRLAMGWKEDIYVRVPNVPLEEEQRSRIAAAMEKMKDFA